MSFYIDFDESCGFAPIFPHRECIEGWLGYKRSLQLIYTVYIVMKLIILAPCFL